jgi:CBS domain-containing protein
MRISDILRAKGNAVFTVTGTSSVRELLATLAEHDIGAVVVVDDTGVIGIASERDVVRRLHDRGAALLDESVSTVMSPDVHMCAPGDDVDAIAQEMTERRVRHVPVLESGELAGLVSIGDVVKSRIAQLELDRGQLEHYITG